MPTFESADGLMLSYDSEGDGPAVVLIHGYATDGYTNWIRPGIVGRLTTAGYRAITLDQRGHGLSGKPHDPASYSDDVMVDDVRALLDDAAVQACACVGYSMGALNTLRVLLAGESRIKVAILGGIGEASLRVRESTVIADAMLTEDRSTITNPVAKSFRDFAELTRADRHALAALQRREVRPITRVDTVSVPTLVVAAEGDPLIGDPHALAEMIPGGRAVVVEGTHLNVVNNPRFHEAVLAFLDEHKGAFS